MNQPGVGYLGVNTRQTFELGQSDELLEARIGNACAVKFKHFALRQATEML